VFGVEDFNILKFIKQESGWLVDEATWRGMFLNGKPICDDYWDDKDAKVVCRMLGFSTDGAIATTRSQFGRVSRDFIMDDVKCQGSETDINDCNHRDTHNCGRSEGAGVRCRMSAGDDNFSAGDEEFFSSDLEEPHSTCSSNADCPSHLACIRSVLSSDPGTCGDPWCWREEWDCGSGARCIIVNHHPLCQGTDE